MTTTAPRRRTLPITFLALIAAVAGAIATLNTLRFLGLLPKAVGPMSFYSFSFWGAVLSAILALIWFSTAAQLWRLDPRGWLFVVLVATLNLVFLVMALIGHSSWDQVSGGILVNGIALLLGLLPGTKEAFGMPVAQAKR